MKQFTRSIAAAAGVALALPAGASAALFRVDSTKDGVDALPGDDICATARGDCTIRAAIDAANQAAGGDEIKLPKGVFELKRPEAPVGANAEGDLDVTEAVEIDGRGPDKTVIRQTVNDGVLNNDAPFSGFSEPGLQLSDVTITGGQVGGISEVGGGGIQNNEFALVSNVVVRDNVAVSDAEDNVPGAGIMSAGTLALANTTVRDNIARGRGDTTPSAAGILVQDGGLTLQDGTRIVNNTVRLRDGEGTGSSTGGGIVLRNPGGEADDAMSVFDSTIAGNSALGGPFARGGGIHAGVGTYLDITRSTISGNRSRLAGGLYATSSEINVNDSTFSGNSDTRDGAAAIFQQSGPGMVELRQVTIAKNKPSAGHFSIESGEQAQAGSLTLFASIVANQGPECGGEAGAVSSGGRNIVGDQTCGFNPGMGLDIEANPDLRELGDYGGPTETHALKPSSPAIDHFAGCAASVDQRGVSRPQGGACDSGAFEKR